ncbi:MAG TPA: BlaI/MecI/CopY family transcriptional regulator [Candidatus Mediterraneibacter vanvlietii]|nr:BlaI/MecI/CopY family transcriptional regulator [Candidatus Mediterraneibacter vanvlietii]
MKKLPQISEAEFEVMKIVWENAPVSTNDITDRLVQTTDWSPKTIQTLIRRLVSKGALTYEKNGRVFVYMPKVNEDEYLMQKSSSFISRYFGGDFSAMFSSYLGNDELTDEELKNLKRIIEDRVEKGDK